MEEGRRHSEDKGRGGAEAGGSPAEASRAVPITSTIPKESNSSCQRPLEALGASDLLGRAPQLGKGMYVSPLYSPRRGLLPSDRGSPPLAWEIPQQRPRIGVLPRTFSPEPDAVGKRRLLSPFLHHKRAANHKTSSVARGTQGRPTDFFFF